jgi:hypothetical protein
VYPILLIQELQAIKFKQDNNRYINQDKFMSYYVMTATNKLLLISENHGDSNRCTPCRGKSKQYVTRFPHSIRVGSQTIHLTWSM